MSRLPPESRWPSKSGSFEWTWEIATGRVRYSSVVGNGEDGALKLGRTNAPVIRVGRLTSGDAEMLSRAETRWGVGEGPRSRSESALTSTAALIECVDRVDRDRVKRWLDQVQSATNEIAIHFVTETVFGTHYCEARGAVSSYRDGIPVTVAGSLRKLDKAGAGIGFGPGVGAEVGSGVGVEVGSATGARPHSDPVRADALNNAQLVLLGEIANRIAEHEPLERVTAMIKDAVEASITDCFAYVLAVDRPSNRFRIVAGPDSHESYRTMIECEAIAAANLPSSKAVMRGEWSVFTDFADGDIAGWYRDVMSEFGYGASWVAPIQAAAGGVLATITVVLRERRSPKPYETEWVKRLALLAQLAFEREIAAGVLSGYVQHDPLTGVLNHTAMVERVEERLRKGDDQFSMLMVMLDRFRVFRERIGHANAEQVLIAAADRIAASVGGVGRVAHLEQGEFAAIVDCRSRAHQTADQLLKAFDDPLPYDSGELLLVPTIGIVDAAGSEDAHTLFVDGVAALNEAGAVGGGHISHFDSGMRSVVLDRIRLGSDLRHAIDTDQLELHYQPIVDLVRGECMLAEALVRWRHPARGLLAPDEFIGLAEESGLIIPIGTEVLRIAIAQVKRWRERWPDFRVAVNVSPRQLALPEFPEMILELLAEHEVEADAIKLELTESNLMGGIEVFEDQLAELGARGLAVMIDDFGTGLSSLSRLYELPISAVKIDQSFIQRLARDETAQAVVRAINEIARSHSCRVIAEGIEDVATAALVSEARCDYGQGFYFSRPMEPARLARWLEVYGWVRGR